MKNKILAFSISITCLLFTQNIFAQSVGINATGAAPNSSALLDLSSTNKGFLITRADTANIVAPAFGLMTLAPLDSCLYMFNGVNWKSVGGVGTSCSCTATSTPSTFVFPCGGTVIPVVEVLNPATGKTWMDRNLGASQIATSSADLAGYGDLYQWGRCSDGHEKRTAAQIFTPSSANTPGHGDFIVNIPDWRVPQNNNLWQGLAGVNNPCPTGYRIPTSAEFDAELATWATIDAAGAYGSPLKLTAGGTRTNTTGAFGSVGTFGYYWSSTIDVNSSIALVFNGGFAAVLASGSRAYGYSVRCIKD
ncbi:MAG: FISUMP domain-containing protein [Crocinitomicaceae bacterium]|nr:FISUMP domain-containing protein [Crocinitomicaceae bacterium]